jgi:enolase-phosphatase E1
MSDKRMAVRGVLLDIEGTTSSVRFVYDEMFPFARRETPAYLAKHWASPALRDALGKMAVDAGHADWNAWIAASGADSTAAQQKLVVDEVGSLMDRDAKATGLKALQGLVWEAGFKSGALRSHLYDDVVPAIKLWQAMDLDVRIYSSGSVHAQKLFFAHSLAGNLLSYFGGHYDTGIGGKRESDSYRRIAVEFDLPPEEIVFLSDIVAELDAARSAGMQTCLSLRPENAPVADAHGHVAVKSFEELELLLAGR